jgi:hypothetical protein
MKTFARFMMDVLERAGVQAKKIGSRSLVTAEDVAAIVSNRSRSRLAVTGDEQTKLWILRPVIDSDYQMSRSG